jgi:hypothetical protein
MRRASGAATVALGGPLAVAFVAACRAIAGINGDLTYAPGQPDSGSAHRPEDSGMHDAGADARTARHVDSGLVPIPDSSCPPTTADALFVVDGGLGPILLSDASVFAEVVYPSYTPYSSRKTNAPYSGLVGCAKEHCTRPTTIADYGQPDAGVQWGGAAMGPSGLYTSVSSLSPVTSTGDSGAPQDEGSISALGGDGGPPRSVRRGLADPYFMAATGDTLYWIDDPRSMSNGLAGTWRVFRCSLPACSDAQVFMQGTAFETYGIFLDSTNVYVVANTASASIGDPTSDLYSCSASGACAPKTVLSQLFSPNANPYPADPLAGGDSLVSDGTTLFISDFTTSQVQKLVNGQPVSLVDVPTSPGSVAVDATYVYWSVNEDNNIQRTRKDGAWGGSFQSIVCNPGMVGDIAVDGTGLYFETIAATSTTLWHVPIPPP